MSKSRLPRTEDEINEFLSKLAPGTTYTVTQAGETRTVTVPDGGHITCKPQTRKKEVDSKKAAKDSLVPAACVVDAQGILRMLVPIATKSEANTRDWRGRSQRAGAAWKATRLAARLDLFAPFEHHYRSGGGIQAVFTRLGGNRIDSMANLGVSMKGVEDAVAYLVGANDGSDQWQAVAAQEPRTAQKIDGGVGVRVELRCVPLPEKTE